MLPYDVRDDAHRGGGQTDDPSGASAQFLASLAINSGLGLAFFLTFVVLRSTSPSVYSPRSHGRRLLAAQPPPPLLPHALFAWLGPLLAIDETCTLETAGLDVAMYLRFLRVAFQIMIAASLFGFAVLIPIIRFAPDLSFPDTQTSPQSWLDSNSTSGNSSSEQAVPWLDNLSITHVRIGSPLFYAHLALAYLLTFLTLFLLHVNYRGYASLRQHRFILRGQYTGERCTEHRESMPDCFDAFVDDKEELRMAPPPPHCCTVQNHHSWVLVNDIPEEYRSEEALGTFFAQMYPHAYACCIFARDTRVVAKKVAKRQTVLEKLEHCCAKAQFRARYGREETYLPRVTRGCTRTVLPSSARKDAELRLFLQEQLDALNADIAASLARSNLPTSNDVDTNPRVHTHAHTHPHARPTPSEVDEFGEWSSDDEVQLVAQSPPNPAPQGLQRMVDMMEHLTGIDIDGNGRTGGLDNPVLGSAFVAFRDLRSAIHAQLVQHHTDARSFTVKACPSPADVVWHNVGMPANLRFTRKLVILTATFCLTFFWTVPVGLITSFSQLDNLVRLFPVLEPVLYGMSPWLRQVLSSFIPALVLMSFMSLLPHILRVMVMMEGIEAHSWICECVLRRHFYFQLINVFLGVAVSTGMLSIVIKFADHPTSLVQILGALGRGLFS